MKKVINGKRYDTDTAILCGSMSYGQGPRDFNHYSEDLYQKRTGEFFLYGEGGPRSPYAEEVAMNEWSGGESIRPLTIDEAKQWVEANLDADDYEKLFTIEEEPDPGKKIQSFSLDGATIAALTKLAISHNMSKSQIICQLVKQEAEKRKLIKKAES